MMCPECDGSGRVRKRFLIFFERSARCRKCLGSGEFPPPVAHRNRYMRYARDEDRDAWATTGIGAATIGAIESAASGAPVPDDTFEVGTGGRSGGAGGGATWGDAADDKAPVIVDPFAGVTAAVTAGIVAEAADAADSGRSSDRSSSDAGQPSSGDSGTSY
jgi:hypothetical protein